METHDEQQQEQATPITVTSSVIPRQQQITTDQQLNLDMDFEMTSDNEESSASANNSRSFSPNYSPNSNQIETGEMNMLNREAATTETETQSQQAQPQVSNLNIQDQAVAMEEDHPMGDAEINEANMQIEASQVPLPRDDSDLDDTESGSLTEEELNEEEKAEDGNEVTGESSQANADEGATASAQNNEESENATGGTVQEIDPAIRAILGDLEVPEGIDPSFLAALPPEMRDEVIQEHLR